MEQQQSQAVVGRELSALVADVLGRLAFMVEDDVGVEPRAGVSWLCGEITYHGPVSGSLTCWCQRTFAVQLAANLLGLEPGQQEAATACEDALQEFLNVLCGQLVTDWYGRSAVFNLSIPIVRSVAGLPQLAPPSPRGHCQLSVGGEYFVCVHRA